MDPACRRRGADCGPGARIRALVTGHAGLPDLGAHLPPMGVRVRLKRSVTISGLPYQARVVAEALKRYGMILADEVVDTSSLPHPGL